jgi:hypothetical protein
MMLAWISCISEQRERYCFPSYFLAWPGHIGGTMNRMRCFEVLIKNRSVETSACYQSSQLCLLPSHVIL